jgi:5-methylthioadenosine/S-adenosylhomocysteine deaminase
MVLKKWFTCMTGPSAAALTVEDAHVAALHGCVESIRSGVTTLVDFMYVHPVPGLTQAVIDAFTTTGMRGFVCRGFMTTGADLGVPPNLVEDPRPRSPMRQRSFVRTMTRERGSESASHRA